MLAYCPQVPDGDWICAFNPDPAYRDCSVPEQSLDSKDGDDGGEQLAILHAPGFVPAGDAAAEGTQPDVDNVAFFQRLLGQRTGSGGVARRTPMAAVWWLASEAAIPVRNLLQAPAFVLIIQGTVIAIP